MKIYNTFTNAKEYLSEGHKIVPTKPAIWEKTKNLFQFQDQKYLIEYYEKMGGKWTIKQKPLVESKPAVKKPVVEQPVKETSVIEDDVDLGPLAGSSSAGLRMWAKRLRKVDPSAYNRFTNWD